MRKLIKYILVAATLIACKPENQKDCFKGNGKIITTTRSLSEFKEVVLNDYIDYEIIPSTGYKIEITAGENLMSNIVASIDNYSLTIENKNRCNFVRGYKHYPSIKIFMPKLKTLYHQGVGKTKISSDFNQDSIFIVGENSGDVYLSGAYNFVRTSSHGNTNIHFNGTSKELTSYLKGTNFLYAEDAKISQDINVTGISIGDVYLRAQPTASLVVNLQRDGNVFYSGNPVIILDKSEGNQKGKLIKND
ncbi:MAG: GIN domain-containing protein [Bacteroidota bacterium]